MNKQIQSFTIPLIASNLINIVISQISLIIISQNSTKSLAIVTTIDSFLYSFGGILGVISLAFNIYGAKAIGANDTKKLRVYVSSILWLNIGIGSAFMLIMLLFSHQIIQLIYGFSGEVLTIATTYAFIMSPYILFTLLTFAFTNLLKIEKKTNRIFSISLFSAVLQLFLSYLLVNGVGGIPPMGIIGIGIASMISLAFIIIAYCVLLKEILWGSMKYKPTKMMFLFVKSIPMMMQECFEGILFIIAFEGVVARLGVNILATYAIVNQGLMIAKLPTLMYGNAVTVFASRANGQKNYKEIYQVGKITFFSSLITYLLSISLIWIFKDSFFHIFTDNESIFQLMPAMMPIMFMMMISTPLYEISKYLLQSLELSSRVFFLTACINIIILLIILILSHIKILSFTLLYSLYGINFFILGILFFSTFLVYMKKYFSA